MAILGYLVAHAVFLDSGGWRHRLLALLPHAGVVAAWQVLYTGQGYGVLGAPKKPETKFVHPGELQASASMCGDAHSRPMLRCRA